MSPASDTSTTPARIEYLKVQNFRALREVEFKDMTPLTVLLGPNGSGKSTVFDVFTFLSECFELGLRRAWDKRGRAKELKTRGGDGPVSSRSSTGNRASRSSPTTWRSTSGLAARWWSRNGCSGSVAATGQPFRFLDYREGRAAPSAASCRTSRTSVSRLR